MTNMFPLFQIDLSTISSDAAIASSIAIILGAVFVVFQMRQDEKLIASAAQQADSAAQQAKFTLKQLEQNNQLATMDLIMRIYEFADSKEFGSSWLTVLKSKVSSVEDYESLPEEKQVAFYQVGSLFESIGLLVERGFVKPDLIDDMFATQLAWETMKPFITDMRAKYRSEDYYFFFERLYGRLANLQTGSITAEYLASRARDNAQNAKAEMTEAESRRTPSS